MKKEKLLIRIFASPFIFGVLVVFYTFNMLRHFFGFLRYGGEWVTYRKNDKERINDIFLYLKKTVPEKKAESEFGSPCKKCGNPVWMESHKGYCYLCDPGVFD